MHLLEAMPAADFLLYQAYAADRLLPLQRLELHLARIGQQLDAIAGRQPRPVDDYLIPNRRASDPQPGAADELTDEQADALAASIGFNPTPRRPRSQPEEPDNPSSETP